MTGFVGVNPVGAEAVDKVIIYEKTVSDVDAFKAIFLSGFNNNIVICFLPAIDLVNVSEPFENIIFIEIS